MGPTSPKVGSALDDLSSLYFGENKFAEAERVYARLLTVEEKTFGSHSVIVANTLDNYATTLHKLNQNGEAAKVEERVRTIRASGRASKPSVN